MVLFGIVIAGAHALEVGSAILTRALAKTGVTTLTGEMIVKVPRQLVMGRTPMDS
jgi:hypothetical protein